MDAGILVILAIVESVAIFLSIRWKLFSRAPKIDGRLVIEQRDEKTFASFEFDEYEKMVQLRHKQIVVFEVVGPEELVVGSSDIDS